MRQRLGEPKLAQQPSSSRCFGHPGIDVIDSIGNTELSFDARTQQRCHVGWNSYVKKIDLLLGRQFSDSLVIPGQRPEPDVPDDAHWFNRESPDLNDLQVLG